MPRPRAVVAAALAAMASAACDGRPDQPVGYVPNWIRDAANPVIVPSELTPTGTQYESSVEGLDVVLDDRAGVWRAWYATRVVDTTIADAPSTAVIRCAESSDGVHWTVLGDPALAPAEPNAWDMSDLAAPTVVRNPDPSAPAQRTWLMFYAGANSYADAAAGRPRIGRDPRYAIGLAYSADARTFARADVRPGSPGLVLTAADVLADSHAQFGDGLVGEPDAVVDGGVIRLYCSSYAESVDATSGARALLAAGISLMDSTDGAHWTQPATNPLASLARPGAASASLQPSVVRDPASGQLKMWFRNDTADEVTQVPALFAPSIGYWVATSANGVDWTPDFAARDFVGERNRSYERFGLRGDCAVVLSSSGIEFLFYGAWGQIGADPFRYVVPVRDGGTVPAVTAWNVAARITVIAR